MGIFLLFFPDDLRDYFCDNTIRKCEKLSVNCMKPHCAIPCVNALEREYDVRTVYTLNSACTRIEGRYIRTLAAAQISTRDASNASIYWSIKV